MNRSRCGIAMWLPAMVSRKLVLVILKLLPVLLVATVAIAAENKPLVNPPVAPFQQSKQGRPDAQPSEKWHLARARDPRTGKEAISITRAADLDGSDAEFAGLMLRCADFDFEVVFAMVLPISPKFRPRVTINGKQFDAQIVPPGLAVLLPGEVTTLAKNDWPSRQRLQVVIKTAENDVKGTVSTDGLSSALNLLATACGSR
jgi:hypothetical protein